MSWRTMQSFILISKNHNIFFLMSPIFLFFSFKKKSYKRTTYLLKYINSILIESGFFVRYEIFNRHTYKSLYNKCVVTLVYMGIPYLIL